MNFEMFIVHHQFSKSIYYLILGCLNIVGCGCESIYPTSWTKQFLSANDFAW